MTTTNQPTAPPQIPEPMPDWPSVRCGCGFIAQLFEEDPSVNSHLRGIYREHVEQGCPLAPQPSAAQLLVHRAFSYAGLVSLLLLSVAVISIIAAANGLNPFTWQPR